MLGIYDIHRRYEQQLTREFIDIDAKDVAPYYLSRLESVAILAKWENRPKASFDYISKLRSSRGETEMVFAASQLESIEEEFTCLIRRAIYDRVAHEIVSLVAAAHINNKKLYPYIPEILQLCIEAIVGGQFPRPTNEYKRKQFLRNLKIVMLLESLTYRGIPPTRNFGTAPGQYGIDIVAKLMKLSHEAIATIWKERYKYYSGNINSWRKYRQLFISGATTTAMKIYKEKLVSYGDGSIYNDESSVRGFREGSSSPLSTYVLPWARSPY